MAIKLSVVKNGCVVYAGVSELCGSGTCVLSIKVQSVVSKITSRNHRCGLKESALMRSEAGWQSY